MQLTKSIIVFWYLFNAGSIILQIKAISANVKMLLRCKNDVSHAISEQNVLWHGFLSWQPSHSYPVFNPFLHWIYCVFKPSTICPLPSRFTTLNSNTYHFSWAFSICWFEHNIIHERRVECGFNTMLCTASPEPLYASYIADLTTSSCKELCHKCVNYHFYGICFVYKNYKEISVHAICPWKSKFEASLYDKLLRQTIKLKILLPRHIAPNIAPALVDN